jgi:hypothetical protein
VLFINFRNGPYEQVNTSTREPLCIDKRKHLIMKAICNLTTNNSNTLIKKTVIIN